MGSKKSNKRIVGVVLAALFFAVPLAWCPSLHAQTGMMSPYSVLGPGYVQPYLNVRNMGLGGISTSLSGPGNMNPLNPGSYRSGVDTLSVRFDIGFNISLNHLTQNGGDGRHTNQSMSGGLSNIEFYFPVCKWYKMGFYLLPLTDMFYQTSYFDDNGGLKPVIGTTRLTHEGKGGLAKLGWGHSLGWGPVSVGVNLNYIFGNFSQYSTLTFLNDTLASDAGVSRYYSESRLNGFGLDVGLTVRPRVAPMQYVTIGASYSLQSTLYGSRSTMAEGIYSAYYDTAYVPNIPAKGKVLFPSTLRAGFGYEYLEHFLVGIDVTYTWWNQYEEYGSRFDASSTGEHNGYYFRNTYQINLGAELARNPQATTVARRFAYRIGGFFGNNYTVYQGKDLYSYGFSIGLGIPIRKSRSIINVGLQFGQTGSLGRGQVRENFMRIGVSFSDMETWFVKPKYD